MGDTQDKQASCHREGNLHCRTSNWKLGQAFVESRVKWTEASCLESKASTFNHILVQNTYTPFLDLRGTQPPWEAWAVPFTPQVALSFCWVYSWLTFPPHAHILTGRSMANTVNSGWKLSWFLAHFFFRSNFWQDTWLFAPGTTVLNPQYWSGSSLDAGSGEISALKLSVCWWNSVSHYWR